jgi:hypothetical protein
VATACGTSATGSHRFLKLARVPRVRSIETRSLPSLTRSYPKARSPRRRLPCSLALPVLAPATLPALPSSRVIETRLLPSSLAATHRGFAFYVAFPKRSIFSLATCSVSLIPLARLFSLLTVHRLLLIDHFFAASPTGSSLPWQFVNRKEPIRLCQSFGSLVVG